MISRRDENDLGKKPQSANRENQWGLRIGEQLCVNKRIPEMSNLVLLKKLQISEKRPDRHTHQSFYFGNRSQSESGAFYK